MQCVPGRSPGTRNARTEASTEGSRPLGRPRASPAKDDARKKAVSSPSARGVAGRWVDVADEIHRRARGDGQACRSARIDVTGRGAAIADEGIWTSRGWNRPGQQAGGEGTVGHGTRKDALVGRVGSGSLVMGHAGVGSVIGPVIQAKNFEAQAAAESARTAVVGSGCHLPLVGVSQGQCLWRYQRCAGDMLVTNELSRVR